MLILSLTAWAADVEAISYRRQTLEDGLDVMVIHRPDAQRTTLTIAFDGGPCGERENQHPGPR